jgi:hypothetical protein
MVLHERRYDGAIVGPLTTGRATLTTRARKFQSARFEEISRPTLEGAAQLTQRSEGRVLAGAL